MLCFPLQYVPSATTFVMIKRSVDARVVNATCIVCAEVLGSIGLYYILSLTRPVIIHHSGPRKPQWEISGERVETRIIMQYLTLCAIAKQDTGTALNTYIPSQSLAFITPWKNKSRLAWSKRWRHDSNGKAAAGPRGSSVDFSFTTTNAHMQPISSQAKKNHNLLPALPLSPLYDKISAPDCATALPSSIATVTQDFRMIEYLLPPERSFGSGRLSALNFHLKDPLTKPNWHLKIREDYESSTSLFREIYCTHHTHPLRPPWDAQATILSLRLSHGNLACVSRTATSTFGLTRLVTIDPLGPRGHWRRLLAGRCCLGGNALLMQVSTMHGLTYEACLGIFDVIFNLRAGYNKQRNYERSKIKKVGRANRYWTMYTLRTRMWIDNIQRLISIESGCSEEPLREADIKPDRREHGTAHSSRPTFSYPFEYTKPDLGKGLAFCSGKCPDLDVTLLGPGLEASTPYHKGKAKNGNIFWFAYTLEFGKRIFI
ncbi:hypothetical protein BDZ94DRAFT_1238634 [Collybia nuda]|uniref:Uncharacterized protein n=1 Tax=Collybia nuda TaxID=64659 RepID=A0A9P6CFH5_9AGAR|nr:hypothetical protein BDZ94DRAFT_1238634 [Collybia nuda]